VSAVRFATVILDADSTLSGIEGIDWLAAQRDPAVEQEVSDLTSAAMRGEIPLESVYGLRMEKVRPTENDLTALSWAYRKALAPDARDVMQAGRAAGIRWVIVSGGLRPALLPLARSVGVPPEDVHAVHVDFHEDGSYAGFDETSPLARAGGKPTLVRSLGALHGPVLAVGDGQTDAELRSVVDEFWAYTGFVERPSVVARADQSVRSFTELWSALQKR
jgi:phosphoserine phosphatase